MDLVLVPGHLCDARLWDHQSRHLCDLADIHIAETGKDDSMAGMAARLLEHAPDRFALAGLSMGGMICMEVMRQAPERVERLALLDTNAMPDMPERAAARRDMLEQARSGEIDAVIDGFMDAVLPPGRRHEPSLSIPVREMMASVAAHSLEDQVKALSDRPDSRPDLPGYTLPVLLVCGRQDMLTPLAWHEEMARLIPDARLAVIEECAHMSTMERPHAVTALLRDWLLYR